MADVNLWGLVETGEDSDFTILITSIDPPEEFKVHKLILKSISPVFRAMFENDMKESRTGVIEIDDIKPETMKRVLRNIYGCKIENGSLLEDVFDLMVVADKYQMKKLTHVYTDYIMNNFLTIESCPAILSHIALFAPLTYDIHCLDIVKKYPIELFKNKSMLNISEDTLVKILELDEINVDSELNVLNFVAKWALVRVENTVKDNTLFKDISIRKVLENKLLPLLRFLTLTKDEIMIEFSVSTILTSEERQILLTVVTDKTNETISLPHNFPTYLSKSTIKRSFDNNKKPIEDLQALPKTILDVIRLGITTKHWRDYTNINHCDFVFQTKSIGIKLFGFRMTPSVEAIGPLRLFIHIRDKDGILINRTVTIYGKFINARESCWLKHPFILKPNHEYHVTLSHSSEQTIESEGVNIIVPEDVKGNLGPITGLICQNI